MKKMLFVLFLLVMILPMHILAQSYAVDKGSLLIDGSISFSSESGNRVGPAGQPAEDQKVDDNDLKSFTFNPTIGYFFLPNFASALEFLYTSEKQGDFKINAFGFGPKVVYFYGNANSKLFPFIGASLIYVKSKNAVKESQLNITFSLGATLMVAKNVGITGKVYATRGRNKPENSDQVLEGHKTGIVIGVSTFIF